MPSRARTTRPVVPPSRPAQFGGNVSVRLTRSVSFTATGQGPGEFSGPAVAVTLALSNGSGRTISAANSVVTADYGTSHTPAPTVSGQQCTPWKGSVRTGSSISGTYCFSIPTNQRSRVTLTISYDPDQPVVVISGSVR